MWTKKSIVAYMFYKLLAAWLPISQRSGLSKRIRVFFAKKILKYSGENINIERNAYFTPEVSVDDYSSVGINCEIYGPVNIGKKVMMGPECVIYTTGHSHERIDIPMMEQGYIDPQPVVIEDDVWIGRRVMIMPGVTIGHGSVIGAGAVVTKNIPPFSIAAGVPAKIVKSRLK